MDGSIEVDTATLAPTVAPVAQDISHWAAARAPALVKKPREPSPLPSQISGEHARKAAEALRNACPWVSLPGGPLFWNAVTKYLEELAQYAAGKRPFAPPTPVVIQKAVE